MGSQLAVTVSVITLIVTVIYYYKMVVLTELTTEATLFNTLYSEYATPHMLDAIRAVEDFSHTTNLSAKQIICKGNNERLWDKKFDHEWQRLFHWYQKVVYFHRMNLLSDKFYTEFPGPMRTQHFIQHVEPFAINACEHHKQANCSEIFHYLRNLYNLPPRDVITCDKSTKKTKKKTSKSMDEL